MCACRGVYVCVCVHVSLSVACVEACICRCLCVCVRVHVSLLWRVARCVFTPVRVDLMCVQKLHEMYLALSVHTRGAS